MRPIDMLSAFIIAGVGSLLGAVMMMIARQAEPSQRAPLNLCLYGFLILGVPVAFAIGLSALCTILYEGLPVAVIFQQMMSGMNIFSFLAIPFFVFSGELMLHGGVADKIVQLPRDELRAQVSPMQWSFLCESRRPSNARMKRELGLVLRHPGLSLVPSPLDMGAVPIG